MSAYAVTSYVQYPSRMNVVDCGDGNSSFVTAFVENQNKEDSSVCYVPRPFNISFICKRTKEAVHHRMDALYKVIVLDSIHLKLEANPAGCHPNSILGNCGNVRDFLTECRCKELDRKKNWQLRSLYEKAVIDRLEQHVKAGYKSINIAMFATGGLHGELVLMIKLIERFKNRFSGIFNLYLIDLVYAEAINKGAEFSSKLPLPNGVTYQWNQVIGGRRDLEQFLNEIALSLPPNIVVSGAVFGSHTDYLERAKADDNFKHDLLIGSDIDNTAKEVIQIQKEGSRSGVNGIALAKINSIPNLCEIANSMFCSILSPSINSTAAAESDQKGSTANVSLSVPVVNSSGSGAAIAASVSSLNSVSVAACQVNHKHSG